MPPQCDNSTRNGCSSGTANDAAIPDTATEYRWRCDGSGGAGNSGTCSKAKPVNGVCNNSTRNGCSSGTANDAAVADATNEYRWRCDGSHGGRNSGTCSKAAPTLCAPNGGCVSGAQRLHGDCPDNERETPGQCFWICILGNRSETCYD